MYIHQCDNVRDNTSGYNRQPNHEYHPLVYYDRPDPIGNIRCESFQAASETNCFCSIVSYKLFFLSCISRRQTMLVNLTISYRWKKSCKLRAASFESKVFTFKYLPNIKRHTRATLCSINF